MRVVHDRRRVRRAPDTLTVEDLLSAEAFDADGLGHEYLAEGVREQRKFLPPPRVRARRKAVPPREPESRLSKVAKLAGLTAAASLLVGAVVASSVVTRERTEQTSRTNPEPPPITGAAALGAFAAQSGSELHRHDGPPPSSAPAPSQGSVGQAASKSPSPASATSPAPAALTDAQKLALVGEFYHRIGSRHGADALAMLSPALAGDATGDLLRAWGSMSAVDVNEARVRPDGSVLAVVTMHQQNGVQLKVTQVLSLAPDATGKIAQAVLLSAEQLS